LGSHFKGEGSCKKNEIAFPLPPILEREVGREEKKYSIHSKGMGSLSTHSRGEEGCNFFF
jgi:hypothetical protein